jgi:hypothetical protein
MIRPPSSRGAERAVAAQKAAQVLLQLDCFGLRRRNAEERRGHPVIETARSKTGQGEASK